MPEQRKRFHCVAEITLSTTFLLASEVLAIAAFARSGLPQERNFKKRKRGTNASVSLANASGYQNSLRACISNAYVIAFWTTLTVVRFVMQSNP